MQELPSRLIQLEAAAAIMRQPVVLSQLPDALAVLLIGSLASCSRVRTGRRLRVEHEGSALLPGCCIRRFSPASASATV